MSTPIPFPPAQTPSITLTLNLTTLHFYNYTLHANATLSNSSSTCVALFAPYLSPNSPIHIFPNGTFANATSCLNLPILPVRIRGAVGCVLGVGFVGALVWTLANAGKKEGLGRWGRAWGLLTAACGAVSAFVGIDVDRDYVPGTAVVLQAFFYSLLLPGILGVAWEGIRIPIPLIFYTPLTALVLTTLPRPWSALQLQRSEAQTAFVARPTATDLRFKIGAGFAVLCLLLILLQAAKRGRSVRRLKFLPVVLLVAVRACYTAASAWLWSISPYNVGASAGWIHGLGYTPVLLILLVFNAYAYVDRNENSAPRQRGGDEVELRQRGLPAISGSSSSSIRREWSASFRSGETVIRRRDEGGGWWWQRRRNDAGGGQADSVALSARSARYTLGSSMLDVDADPGRIATVSAGVSVRSRDSSTGRRPPQVVRSMLDV